MELKTNIDRTRALLLEGKTQDAYQLILPVLQQDARYVAQARTLSVVLSGINQTRQEEQKGILSFQDAQRVYSKANDTLLEVLDQLEGKTIDSTPARPVKKWMLWAGLFSAVLVLLLFLEQQFLFSTKSDHKPIICPSFVDPGKRILLLPFQKISGSDARPELLLRSRIEALAAKSKFPLNVEILNQYDAAANNPDKEDATAIGTHCNAEMVVWGTYTQSEAGELQLDARYVLPGLKKEGGTGFQKVGEIIAIQTDQGFRTLDDAVFSLCAVLAIGAENDTLAKKWLDMIRVKNQQDAKALEQLAK